MSDFPRGGDVGATRAWLDKEGFVGLFINWKADAILGKSDKYIKSKFPSSPEDQEKAEILCGLLATARQSPQSGGVNYSVKAVFHAYITDLPKVSKRWIFDDYPTIADLTARVNAYYDTLPVRPSSFKVYQDDVELVEDRDFDPRFPTIEIIPSHYILTLEVQSWEVPDNRKCLKEFCAQWRIPAEVKRISGTSVRLKLKHTILNDLDQCKNAIVTMVGSQGKVITGECSEEFESLAQGTLICGSRGLVRSDGVDSLEDYSFSERMSRWSGP